MTAARPIEVTSRPLAPAWTVQDMGELGFPADICATAFELEAQGCQIGITRHARSLEQSSLAMRPNHDGFSADERHLLFSPGHSELGVWVSNLRPQWISRLAADGWRITGEVWDSTVHSIDTSGTPDWALDSLAALPDGDQPPRKLLSLSAEWRESGFYEGPTLTAEDIDAYDLPGLGVQGAEPPAYLDTLQGNSSAAQRNSSGSLQTETGRFQQVDSRTGAAAGTGPPSTPSAAEPRRRGPDGDQFAQKRPYLPCWYDERTWRTGVAIALRGLREWDLANQFESCGRDAFTVKCPSCGADPARIAVQIGCNSRVCPWCQRRASEKSVDEWKEAFELVPRLAELRCVKLIKRFTNQLDGHNRAIIPRLTRATQRFRVLSRRLLAGRAQAGDADEMDALEQKIPVLAKRRNQLRAAIHTLRARTTWSWKWLTIAPKWDPTDRSEYEISGIKRRVRVVGDALRKMAGALRYHGATSLLGNIEASDFGFIHTHVMHYGPIVNEDWINRQVWGEDWKRDAAEKPGTVMVGKIRNRTQKDRYRISYEGTEIGTWGGDSPNEALDQFARERGKSTCRFHKDCDRADGIAKAAAKRIEHKDRTIRRFKNFRDLLQHRGESKKAYVARAWSSVSGGVHETLKYSLKAPSPLAYSWLAGKRRWVAHPTLVARWIVATKGTHLRRAYGLARTAISIVKEKRRAKLAERRIETLPDQCAFCHAALPPNDDPAWKRHPTRHLAYENWRQYLGAEARDRWRRLMRLDLRPSRYAPGRATIADAIGKLGPGYGPP